MTVGFLELSINLTDVGKWDVGQSHVETPPRHPIRNPNRNVGLKSVSSYFSTLNFTIKICKVGSISTYTKTFCFLQVLVYVICQRGGRGDGRRTLCMSSGSDVSLNVTFNLSCRPHVRRLKCRPYKVVWYIG